MNLVERIAKKKKDRKIKNQINLKPTDGLGNQPQRIMYEAEKKGHAVMAFGRMNPPTIGHEMLVNKVKHHAAKVGGTPHVFLSHTNDTKKNPIGYSQKFQWAQKAFGADVVHHTPHTQLLDIVRSLSHKHKELTMVAGSDRVPEYRTLLNKYNGRSYNFDKIHVVSAGERDPDGRGAVGMSGTKMRDAAATGDKKSFKAGLPKALHPHVDDVYSHVRKGLGIHPDLVDEARVPPEERERLANDLIIRDEIKNCVKSGHDLMRIRSHIRDNYGVNISPEAIIGQRQRKPEPKTELDEQFDQFIQNEGCVVELEDKQFVMLMREYLEATGLL